MKMFAILDKAKPDIESTYKRLKLGGGHAYDRSSDKTAVLVNTTRNGIIYCTDLGLTEALYILCTYLYYL
jgi:hypothetical protein